MSAKKDFKHANMTLDQLAKDPDALASEISAFLRGQPLHMKLTKAK